MADEPYTLTRDDLKALREADAVSFHYTAKPTTGPTCYVRLTKKHDTSGSAVWSSENDAERVIEAGVILTAYDRQHTSSDARDIRHAYASSLSARFDPHWQTAVANMKVGDALRLHFIAGNNTETLNKSGLVHDEFDLRIQRTKEGHRPVELTFHIDDTICPMESSARMVQR